MFFSLLRWPPCPRELRCGARPRTSTVSATAQQGSEARFTYELRTRQFRPFVSSSEALARAKCTGAGAGGPREPCHSPHLSHPRSADQVARATCYWLTPTAVLHHPLEPHAHPSDLRCADQVAYSSRMIAAARAAESERSDALFTDKLAAALAGALLRADLQHSAHCRASRRCTIRCAWGCVEPGKLGNR